MICASLTVLLALSNPTDLPTPVEQYSKHLVEHKDQTYHYRLLTPETSSDAYPLVVFLHGAGERGDDNTSQLKYLPTGFVQDAHLRNRACFVLAMQCPPDDQWATFDTHNARPENPTKAMSALIETLHRVLATHPIDRSRIYLTGLSMGGYGSWDLAARHPELFAAVVPICGGGHIETADTLTALPIWAFHGTADQVIPESESTRMIEAIRQAGGTPAYTALDRVGHESWHFAYGPHGAMEWMFAQRKPPLANQAAAVVPANTPPSTSSPSGTP